MDQTSGTTATDVGSSAVNFTYTGTFTLSSASVIPRISDFSVTLDGSTGYVDGGSSAGPDYGPSDANGTGWTVEAWMNTTSSGSGVIVSRGTSTGNARQLALYSANPFEADLCQTTSCNYAVLTGGTFATSTPFYIVLETVGAGSNQLSSADLYVNAVNVSHVTSFTGNLAQEANTYVQIGSRQEASPIRFTGRLDEVAYYTTALSSARITAHYLGGVATPSDWPYTVKAPALPRIRSPDYWTKFVSYGYNTGLFSSKIPRPQFLAVGYPTFDVVPMGNVK